MRCALWPDETDQDSRAEVERWFAGDRRHIHVAFMAHVGDAIVGFAEISLRAYAEGCDTSPVPFLEGWYVEPSHRRRGIATLLLRAAEDWARAKGYSEMGSDALADNAEGIAAHHGAGFEAVETIRCFRKCL